MLDKVFHKTLHRITILGSLWLYVFALILSPIWHVHHYHCNNQSDHTSECCCSSSPVCPSIEPRNDCDLCRILHVTVPLFVLTIALPETANNTSETSVKNATLIVQTIYGIPSCRAPPLDVCS
ncbi:MAG: hypothetical protein LBE12_08250 [Planctomycetaceae bacterium]|jgi:hypothetical protein|nr:hypothetical protein [Planctomycetaceae bacterium]